MIGLEEMSADSIRQYLDLAKKFCDPDGKPVTPDAFRQVLDGRTVGLLFFEPSTRTRASFEIAAKKLGAHTVFLGETGTSVQKGETAIDTALNLEAMGVDAFVVRHKERRVPPELADKLQVPVINAGNGTGEHPTQALLDALTIFHAFDRTDNLDGLRVSIVGDIRHSRVARSNVAALQKLGATVRVAGPNYLMPDDTWGAETATNRKDALDGADVVMVLRIQKERLHREFDQDDYIREWGIDDTIVETELQANAKIMHPGPVIRGVELSSDVADGPRSLILKQVGFGVAVRQAVLCKTMGVE